MIELFIAFGAGLISFLSPCVLPLIPGYISFISGASLNELIEKKKNKLNPVNTIYIRIFFRFYYVWCCSLLLGSSAFAKFTNFKNNCWIDYYNIFSSITWAYKYWFFKF